MTPFIPLIFYFLCCVLLRQYYLSFVHEKKSHIPQTHYSTYYNQAAIDFVANKQKRAIDLYNYNFDRA